MTTYRAASGSLAEDLFIDLFSDTLAKPSKRFEDMQIMHHTKTLGIIQVDEAVWKHLTDDEKVEIERICDEKLAAYYARLK